MVIKLNLNQFQACSQKQDNLGIMWNKYTTLPNLEVVKWRFRHILSHLVEL